MVVECQPVQQPLYDIPSGSLCLLLLFSVRGEGPLVKGLWAYSIGDFVFKNTPHLNALWVPASSHRPLQKFSVFRIPDIFPYNLGVTADWIWQDSFRLNIQIKFYHKNSTYPNIGEQLWTISSAFSKLKRVIFQTSLVVQWLRIHLPMQRTQVQPLVQEDSTCLRAGKPEHQQLKPVHPRVCALQQVKITVVRSLCTTAREWLPLVATSKSPHTAVKTQYSQK